MSFSTIFLLCSIFFMLFSSVLWFILFLEKKEKMDQDPKPKRYPLVSIIIPAHNEEKTIKKSIISCLALNYPKKEIIVVNDGSTDKTAEVCKPFVEKKLIRLINKPNGGKGSALNVGIKKAKGELVACLDADSFFRRDALKHMAGYFENPNVAAVTSSMKIKNPKTWVQKIQWVEYLFAIYLRKLMSYLNCLYVVPGPGSMYRKDVLLKLGGFDENNLTEDMEIAFRMQKNKYKIENSINAVVDTIGPASLRSLIKQRIRWYAGFCDNLKDYRDIIFNPKYTDLGMFMIPASLAWVGLLIYGFFFMAKNFINFISDPIRTYLLVGFDWDIFLKSIRESLHFEPNFLTAFSIILTAVGIAVLYYSIVTSKEKIDIRKNGISYALFMSLYSLLMAIFWGSALLFIFTRKERKWRGDKI